MGYNCEKDYWSISGMGEWSGIVEQQCFLCNPTKQFIYAENQDFFAMLGLGPLIEGYSLLATKAHVYSMIDLPVNKAHELVKFKEQVRYQLALHYGQVILTEHGRVASCVHLDSIQPENHCFHAHNLVFPLSLDLTESLRERGLKLMEFSNFLEAREKFKWSEEYYYFERIDGTCVIAFEPRRLVRQFFRYLIAERIGKPELADWKKYPQIEVVLKARSQLFSEKG
jgi:hypothetical protein